MVRPLERGPAQAHIAGSAQGAIMQVTAILTAAPEGGFVGFNPETGTTTEGATLDETIANLREAVELYLEEFPLRPGPAPLVTTFTVAEHA